MLASSPAISPIVISCLLRHPAMEIIKHLHILGLITLDAVVSSVCLQLILVQPQSLSQKHYYLDSAQATAGLLKIIILILKQFYYAIIQVHQPLMAYK